SDREKAIQTMMETYPEIEGKRYRVRRRSRDGYDDRQMTFYVIHKKTVVTWETQFFESPESKATYDAGESAHALFRARKFLPRRIRKNLTFLPYGFKPGDPLGNFERWSERTRQNVYAFIPVKEGNRVLNEL